MTMPSATIRLQTPDDQSALSYLNECAFGPGRFARTAYRVRENAVRDPRLNFCMELDGEMVAAMDLTPVTVGDVPGALLLGPLIVSGEHKSLGHGLRLMLYGLKRAKDLGHRLVILVGDLPYYARAGFRPIPHGRIELPGPVDPARLLYADLVPGALDEYSGVVRGVRVGPPVCADDAIDSAFPALVG
ncbi:N-acetyltransferase [Rhodomicrobium sp. Az07]|uniref:GNAT family N-acetyltransferase n=1 Tax=Rhodomicrobium sp. Az07 TaxID=2839034 RepID=UPI001BE8EAC1|nr:N-acetyltransferase [Rhodomicrobium sp. Az07]MBT3070394.1 N-acetyltransferase [Rhodomicrobium sp. Az07]